MELNCIWPCYQRFPTFHDFNKSNSIILDVFPHARMYAGMRVPNRDEYSIIEFYRPEVWPELIHLTGNIQADLISFWFFCIYAQCLCVSFHIVHKKNAEIFDSITNIYIDTTKLVVT